MQPLSRYPDWAQRLMAFMQARAAVPFAWGTNDCCSMAADAVLAMTGQDPMATLRGRYTSATGAASRIKRAGGLQPLVSQYMGEPMANIGMVSRGDVVLLANVGGHGPALGVCWADLAYAAGEHGQVVVPMSAAVAAWRV